MLQNRYNEQLLNEKIVEREPNDFLGELPPWNRDIARQLAAEEGVSLTEEHWWILHYLRRRFAKHGQVRYARNLTRELEKEIAGAGGSRHLFELFPGGPVSQGSRIAGLPQPPAHEDRSFGTVQ